MPEGVADESGSGRLRLDVREADGVAVLALLAELSGLQFVADPGVSCRLTLALKDVPSGHALSLVLRACGLASEIEGDILRVAPAARLAEEAESRAQLKEAQARAAPRSLLTVRLSYARVRELGPLVARLIPGADATWDERTNTLFLAVP